MKNYQQAWEDYQRNPNGFDSANYGNPTPILNTGINQNGPISFGNVGPSPAPALSQYGADGNLTPEAQKRFYDYIDGVEMAPDVNGDYAMPARDATPRPSLISDEDNAEIDKQIKEQYPDGQQPQQPQTQQPQQAPQPAQKEPWEMSFAEKMGRYGGNIMSAKGGMAQVGAMGSTTAEIYEAERGQNQQIEENEVARMTKQTTSSAALKKQAEIQNMHDTQIKYDQAIQDFIRYGDTVTGPLDSTLQSVKDSQGFGDAEREAFRYRIKEIIISDTLLQTAKTSGAISDKEMALFRSGVPRMDQQEDVWIAWLKQRSGWLAQINQRISNGTRVGATDAVNFSGYTAPTAASGAAPSALTQTQLDAMKTNTPGK